MKKPSRLKPDNFSQCYYPWFHVCPRCCALVHLADVPDHCQWHNDIEDAIYRKADQ